MERNLYDDELEDFLKRKANLYRLYPSDRVWRGIYTALHKGRKWHIFGGVLLLVNLLTLISLEKTAPPANRTAINAKNIQTKGASASYSINSISGNIDIYKEKNKGIPAISLLSTGQLLTERNETNVQDQTTTPYIAAEDGSTLKRSIELSAISMSSEELSGNSIRTPEVPEIKIKETKGINWLHEKAINNIQRSSSSSKKRLTVQFYLSPTISYRSLQSGKLSSTGQSRLVASGGMRGLVDHTPALGIELGSALQFHMGSNFLLKSGLQLNYVRYNINAYRSFPEKTSITLSGPGSYSPPTTITTYSTLRNFNNGYPEAIQNQYLQLSLPVGAEMKIFGGERLQVNVAGSVQPTYLLMNSAYMLTSDFSNYTKEPSLVRKWNVNTGVETFVSYKTGSVRWQIGPQFRYQLFSSYTDRYPIREHLMEYGMKIGVSKMIK